MASIGRWAAEAEEAGFDSVGVIDRLVYDNLEPLTALAAAAASTKRVQLLSTVINVCWRGNAVLLAKQLSSVARMSGGRLTAGLGMGGWPADYEASGIPLDGRGALFDASLAAMRSAWDAAGDAPTVLIGGTGRRSFSRAASEPSEGWVAPLFGFQVLHDGAAAVARAWADTGRTGEPRVVSGRYFSLGADAAAIADDYIHHYYGAEFFDGARADVLTDGEQIEAELRLLADAGCADLVLFPCSGDPKQVALLADALLEVRS